MRGINIHETFLINLYARNRYERFLYVHQCQSIWNVICFYSLKIQTSEKDEPQSHFSQLTHPNNLLCFYLIS